MRKLNEAQLYQLRAMAQLELELPRDARIDFGVAPEDLIVACDRATGADDMTEEEEEERQALRTTSEERCAEAWKRRRR